MAFISFLNENFHLIVLLLVGGVVCKFLGRALSDEKGASSMRVFALLFCLTFCYLCIYHYKDVPTPILWVIVAAFFVVTGAAKIQDFITIIDKATQLKQVGIQAPVNTTITSTSSQSTTVTAPVTTVTAPVTEN